VPETFVVDKQGVIRQKYTGPLTPQDLSDTLLPLVEKLNAQ
jgi:cytochrome c biogenesis protein CcmG/thiol:disulfide interchange protein DsbE